MEKRFDGSVSFIPEEIKAGLMDEFIHFLVKINAQFRVWTDGYCYVIEYIEDCNVQEGAAFMYVDEDINEKQWSDAYKEGIRDTTLGFLAPEMKAYADSLKRK